MTIVSAFLVPGNPLPLLRPDNKPWEPLVTGFKSAAELLAASKPDVIVAYSTQWIAVLDQLWQTRPRLTGLHVDENWYDYGDLEFDISIDTPLAQACVRGSGDIGVKAKEVDYDGFPIDTGTIVMSKLLAPSADQPFVLAANNLYHDWEMTAKLGAMAAKTASDHGKRVAIVGVGGLSGTIFRSEINIAADRIATERDDSWNKRLLDTLESGNMGAVKALIPEYVGAAKPDMGLKHLAWVLGACDGKITGANVLGYGPVYGSGAAVVQFPLQ
jgi:2-aminophenol/2-amino-5-chlorophenol 1,6-dioxygenase alpha subunit